MSTNTKAMKLSNLAEELLKKGVNEEAIEALKRSMRLSTAEDMKSYLQVAVSLFDNGGIWGTIILSAFALAVVAFLLSWLKNEQSRLVQAALGMIIGGALGNVADRIRFGAVYDFLDFYYNGWHWPAFNAADSFICIGAFLIIVHSLLNHKKQSLKEVVK